MHMLSLSRSSAKLEKEARSDIAFVCSHLSIVVVCMIAVPKGAHRKRNREKEAEREGHEELSLVASGNLRLQR